MGRFWLQMAGYAFLVGVCFIAFVVLYGERKPTYLLEVGTTLGAVFLALATTMLTVDLQRADERNRWTTVLQAELEQMLDVLQRNPRGEFRLELPDRAPLVFELPGMTPVIFQDAVKSGHFDKEISKDLLYLIAKIDSYNLRFNRFLTHIQGNYVIPEDHGEALFQNWNSEIRHIDETKNQILALCRKLSTSLG